MKNTWYDDTVYSEFKGKRYLKDTLKCDVLVVGGGLAGLSLLYNLKKNNVDAVLIEEKQIGSGASGRNGGFCLSGWAQDYDILLNGCHPNSKALSLAKKSKKQGTRRVAKYKGGFAFTIPMAVAGSMLLGGGKGDKMKETIVKLSRGPFPKKYTATLKDIKTNKTRILHFGDSRYEQYKDRTSLKLYANQNHGDKSRQANYYNRHSHEKNRKKAILKEKQKNNYYYTPKLLSHIYLW